MLKMQELSRLTNTPKSTILYYIKEGILPEPQKPKPNLHLYDKSMVEAIKFIQYLQNKFHSSIAEIKAIFSHKEFDTQNPYKTLLHVLDLTMGKGSQKIYSKQSLKEEFDIDEKLITKALNSNIIRLRDGGFTQTEIELLTLLKEATKEELELISLYTKYAKELATLEVKIGKSYINTKDKNQNLKRFFDILLTLKPYIFNFQTLETYKEQK